MREHFAGFSPKSRGGGLALSFTLGTNELLGFGEEEADDSNSNGQSGADPEDGFPGLGRASDTEIGTGGDDITERVTLLEDSRHETSSIDGTVFESHGNGVAIDTTHEETEERANSEKLGKGGAVYGCNLEKTKDDHVDDHGIFAAKLVTGQTEKSGTDGAQEQSEGDGSGDVGLCGVVVLCEFDCLNREGMEIKGIRGPGGQSDEKEEPALSIELGEKTDGVLQRAWGLPFAMGLAVLIRDGNPLLPSEKVAKGLFRSGKGSSDNRIRRFIASHDIGHFGLGYRGEEQLGDLEQIEEGRGGAGVRQQCGAMNAGRKTRRVAGPFIPRPWTFWKEDMEREEQGWTERDLGNTRCVGDTHEV